MLNNLNVKNKIFNWGCNNSNIQPVSGTSIKVIKYL